MARYTIGYDLGSSSVKAALFDLDSGKGVAVAQAPETEMPIAAPRPGWAEQDPERWWRETLAATAKLRTAHAFRPEEVVGVGVAYQMHGLVCLDDAGEVLRPAIIWCDSRAVATGREGSERLGETWCREHLLNQPGNFTASKLAWVRAHEPEIFARVARILLPGEWLAFRMTGRAVTTPSGLSEGMFWDFQEEQPAEKVLNWAGIDAGKTGEVEPTFGEHGAISAEAARELGLKEGTPLGYRAGDQPNNAWSLGVLDPGEVASTCGTSGVVYAVGGEPPADPAERWNVFAHVNHAAAAPRYGALLCLNGAGITYSWVRRLLGGAGELPSYKALDALAEAAPAGADGLTMLPFGNGAERMLGNKNPGASLEGIDFLRHGPGELARAAIEGVAFALAHGLLEMRAAGIPIRSLRAGRANLFLSPVFRRTLAEAAEVRIALVETDGALGAARGAAFGLGHCTSLAEALGGLATIQEDLPGSEDAAAVETAFARWREALRRTTPQP